MMDCLTGGEQYSISFKPGGFMKLEEVYVNWRVEIATPFSIYPLRCEIHTTRRYGS